MRDMSLDLETLGTKPGAPIIAIGAVFFDRDTGKMGSEFYEEIALDSAIRGSTLDADTLAWWMKQGPAARQVFAHNPKRYSAATVLDHFASWARNAGKGTPIVWGNGATFDVSLMEWAYEHQAVGLSPPWHFLAIRDMRTAVDMLGHVKPDYKSTVPMVGMHHNALDDAKYQAMRIAECFIGCKGGTFKPQIETAKKTSKPTTEDDDL